MSRIGKVPVSIPEGVTVEAQGQTLTVRGPKGEQVLELRPEVQARVADGSVSVQIAGDDRLSRSLYGLSRTLIAQRIRGVSEGFTKELEVNGVGYRAQMQGETLVLNLGYSHPIEYLPPEGVRIEVEKNVIRVSGIDAETVGQAAAEIRSFRAPEPYKGKGIKYAGERIRRKAGKAGKAAA
jgi:large subunit ribosomal protein L6